MLEAYFRPIYQACLADPVAKWFSHFSPTFITYLACGTGIFAAVMVAGNYPMLATALLLLSGFLDTLDGSVARMNNRISEKGMVLDIMSDRIVEVAMLIGLFAVNPEHRGVLTLVMLGSCYIYLTTFLIMDVFSPQRTQKGFQYTPGIVERAEAFLLFMLMIWLPNQFTILAYAFTGLVVLSSYLRLSQFMRE